MTRAYSIRTLFGSKRVALAACVALAFGVLAIAQPCIAGGVGTAITYQGQLKQGGDPVNDAADLRFILYDALVGGSQIGLIQEFTSATLVDGLFTVELDFGAGVFENDGRWLEIHVRVPAGSGGYSVLSPRQQVRPAPLSHFALNAHGPNITNLNASNITTGSLPGAQLAGAYANALSFTNPANAFSGFGGSLIGLNASNIATGTIANARTTGTASNTPNTLVLRDSVGNFSAATINAANFTGQGAGITAINASNISLGTLADQRLSSNVPLKSIFNQFTSNNTFGGRVAVGTSATGAFQMNIDASPSAGSGLRINRDVGGVGMALRADSAPLNQKTWSFNNTGPLFQIIPVDDDDISVQTPVFNLTRTGRAGIGTTGPQQELHVVGSGCVTGFLAIGHTSPQQTLHVLGNGAITGSLGIGTATPSARLHVVGGNLEFETSLDAVRTIANSYDILFTKDTDNDNTDAWFRFFTNNTSIEQLRIVDGDEASIAGDGPFVSNGIDYAEGFKAVQADLEAGDVVSLAVGDWESCSRTASAFDRHLIGIVSTNPGFVCGMSFNIENELDADLRAARDDARARGDWELEKNLTLQLMDKVKQAYRPIALAGRVPCKVDASFGPIRAGDRLTSSETPGHAMLQSQPGPSIGIALEDHADGLGLIMVLVQPGWHGGTALPPHQDPIPLAEHANAESPALQLQLTAQQVMIDHLLRRVASLEQRQSE